MTRIPRISPGGVLAAAAILGSTLLAAAPGPTPLAAPPEPAASVTCVFTNPAFAGKCTETASVPDGSSAQQSCESILKCLNDTACLKTYCQATTIRSGWRLDSVKGSQPPRSERRN